MRPACIRLLPQSTLLAAALVGLAALRLLLVVTLPDVDMDSYGHFAAARALLGAPSELAVHWVWLPGWHFLMALLVELRAGFLGVRLFNAAIAAVGPLVLYGAIAHRSRRAAVVAALAWAVAPLANLIATSAQSETLFTLLLVCGCLAVMRRPGVVGGLQGGVCLAGACLLRYEGWVAVVGLALGLAAPAATDADRQRRRTTALAVAIAGVAVVVWCMLRARADGRWFAFVDQTSRFVGGIDRSLGPASILRYTVIVPVKVFGPMWLVALLGLRRASREAPELARASFAILAFLTATCLLGGSLGLERHFVPLVPLACLAIGFGVERLSVRAARLGFGSLVAMLAVHVAVFVVTTRARWAPERAAAEWIDAHAATSNTHVVCTDLALELLTHLPARRFVRELPPRGPAFALGWESRLGAVAEEGTLAGRWGHGGPDGASIVVRVVPADRARSRTSAASNIASGMN